MKDLSGQTGFSEKLTYNLINATGRALTNTAINGGNLEDALKQALIGGIVDTAHGQVAGKIAGIQTDYLAHKLAHALAGCVAGAAAGGACKDGAIGGAVGEIVAEMFDKQRPGMFASAAEKQAFNAKVLGYSKLVAGAVSAYAGGNAQTAITTAETAVANNFLTYNKYNSRASQWGSFKQELDTCKATAGCDVNNVYSRWTVISNDQQKQAMASLDGLFAANPSDASTAGQWFGKAISSMYMQATDVCSATDARCISFVQSQQSQAMAVYRTGLTLAYANDMVDGGGRLRSNLLDVPSSVSKTLGAKGEVIPGTGTKVIAQYGPLSSGPLSSDAANTFRSGTYAEVLTQQPTVLYRVYGGSASEIGSYWTTKAPSGPVQSIIDSALNPAWGNSAINVVKIEVSAGVKFYQGAAAPQGGLVGGGDQVVFPLGFKIDSSWKR